MDIIDLVIFDCDGVLLDSEPIASRTLATALRNAGISISTEEARLRFTGYSEPAIRLMCENDLGLKNTEAVFAGWHASVYEAFRDGLEPMPGIEAVIAALDHPKCVASNSSSERLRNSLGLLDLWQRFSPAIYSADMVAHPKPAPDLPLFCARQFDARPDHCVFIDDSAHGITAALAAGMVAIGFIDPADPRKDRAQVMKRAGAHIIVNGAEELPEALLLAGRMLERTLSEATHQGR